MTKEVTRNKPKNTDPALKRRIAELKAMPKTDLTAREKKVLKAWKAWERAKLEVTGTQKAQNELVGAAEAKLRESVEEGVPPDDERRQLAKLVAIETAFQALDEANAEKKEEMKKSRQTRSLCEKRFRHLVENVAQEELPGMDA